MQTTTLVHVQVNVEDIIFGNRRSAHNCPVALATKRALGLGPGELSVTERDVLVTDQIVWRYCPVPSEVALKIIRFDEGQGMEPFEFDLEVPV